MIISYFNVLNTSMVHYWPLAVTSVAEGFTSIKRIQEFLLKQENKIIKNDQIEKKNNIELLSEENKIKENCNEIIMKNVTAMWDGGGGNGLKDVNLKFSSCELYCIIGIVGSGKTTLLQILLKELEIDLGEMEIHGKISYAAQESWLFEGTVRDNILFTEDYDEERLVFVF